MKLSTIDLVIVGIYLLATVVIGLILQKRASRNMKSYFLGGNSLPWYALGLSNASGMFDISGTMWMVYLAFVYGLKSLWIPWLWPVFNQIFLMIYLSVWLRRSNVLTGAEWIRTRFGDGTGGKLSHMIVVLFAILSAMGFLSYGFIGIGKFIEIFVPWHVIAPFVPFEVAPNHVAHVYGIAFTAIATFYVLMGGMMSIVWTDVLQFLIMTVAAVVIAFIAITKVSPEALAAVVPDGWATPFFGWNLDLDWSELLPAVSQKITDDGFSLFGIFFMMMLLKGMFASMAGPAPNFDMQKILSTKSPADAAKMSGFVSAALLLPRYLMIMGFTVLALVFFSDDFKAQGTAIDFENVLPMAINEFVPVGLMGVLLAGLLAAFMSTFASTVNAVPAYLVNDIYLRYFRPDADRRSMIRVTYIISIVAVVLSTIIGMYITSINSVLQWIVSALYGGYVAANVLKWHWWRFNGYGYFWGMTAGIVAAMVVPPLFPGVLELYLFPLIFLASLVGCVVGTLATPATEMETLAKFYRNVRPWGFWQPVLKYVQETTPAFERNKEFGRDMFNVAVGIVWQSTLTLIPMYIVIREALPLGMSIVVLGISMWILKKNWYDRLDKA